MIGIQYCLVILHQLDQPKQSVWYNQTIAKSLEELKSYNRSRVIVNCIVDGATEIIQKTRTRRTVRFYLGWPGNLLKLCIQSNWSSTCWPVVIWLLAMSSWYNFVVVDNRTTTVMIAEWSFQCDLIQRSTDRFEWDRHWHVQYNLGHGRSKPDEEIGRQRHLVRQW